MFIVMPEGIYGQADDGWDDAFIPAVCLGSTFDWDTQRWLPCPDHGTTFPCEEVANA